MPDDVIEIHIVASNAVFAHVPVSRDTHPPISFWYVYSVIKSQVFPTAIGRKPASSVTRTRRTIKQLTTQHGGVHFLCQNWLKASFAGKIRLRRGCVHVV